MKIDSNRNKHLLLLSIACCISMLTASAQTYPISFTEVIIDSLFTISDRYEQFYHEYPSLSHRNLRREVLTTCVEDCDYRSEGPAVWIHYRLENNTDSDMVVESYDNGVIHSIYESHSFWYKGKEFVSEPEPAVFLVLQNIKVVEENDSCSYFIVPGEAAVGTDRIFFFRGTDFQRRLDSIPYNKVYKSYRENKKLERIARKVLPTVSVKLEVRESAVKDQDLCFF